MDVSTACLDVVLITKQLLEAEITRAAVVSTLRMAVARIGTLLQPVRSTRAVHVIRSNSVVVQMALQLLKDHTSKVIFPFNMCVCYVKYCVYVLMLQGADARTQNLDVVQTIKLQQKVPTLLVAIVPRPSMVAVWTELQMRKARSSRVALKYRSTNKVNNLTNLISI